MKQRNEILRSKLKRIGKKESNKKIIYKKIDTHYSCGKMSKRENLGKIVKMNVAHKIKF